MSPPKAERFGISADGDLAVAKRINAMSQHLAPLYVPIAEANQALAGWGNTHKTLARLEVAAKIYNRALDQLMPELAQLTNNSPSTLRMVFRPSDEFSVGLTPEKIRNVAHYRSFNERLWTRYSGMERPPTYPFGSLDDLSEGEVENNSEALEDEFSAAPGMG